MLVRENYSDDLEVKKGEEFYKEFTFRNIGKTTWTSETVQFLFNNGEGSFEIVENVDRNVPFGSEVTIKVKFTAPIEEKTVSIFFRLSNMDSEKAESFGPKVWCTFKVVDSAEPAPKSALADSEMVAESSSLAEEEPAQPKAESN